MGLFFNRDYPNDTWRERRRVRKRQEWIDSLSEEELAKEYKKAGINPDLPFARTKLHGGSFRGVRREG